MPEGNFFLQASTLSQNRSCDISFQVILCFTDDSNTLEVWKSERVSFGTYVFVANSSSCYQKARNSRTNNLCNGKMSNYQRYSYSPVNVLRLRITRNWDCTWDFQLLSTLYDFYLIYSIHKRKITKICISNFDFSWQWQIWPTPQ